MRCCLALLLAAAADMLSRPPPGLSVLVALMSSSQLERALLTHVLGAGHTALEVGPGRSRA